MASIPIPYIGTGSQGRPVRPPEDHARPSGRGLLLVEELSQEWGVRYGENGKTVWFVVFDDVEAGSPDGSR